MKKDNYKFLEIDSVEEIGNFEDEYVYDLEMEDESHTFMANDILVHNTDSIFVSFKPCMDHCDWKDKVFNKPYLESLQERFIVLSKRELNIENPNLVGKVISEGSTDEDIERFKRCFK